MSDAALHPIGNRRTVRLSDVPAPPVERFRTIVSDAVADGARIVALFGLPEDPARLRLIAVLADDERNQLGVLGTVVGDRYPALTPDCPQASLFERELAEQCGVTPGGHPAMKPVRRHPADHAPPSWPVGAHSRDDYPFFELTGEEVHEVAVGPVHAGVIEPGHFRFQAHGEQVLHLEIVLGYQHRGVEPLLERLPREKAILVAESIAGDMVIAHSSACCGALEALARSHKSPRAQSIRGVALELERVANHLGDLGALASDVAYQPAAAYFGRLRGDCLNLLLTISGNRYGRGLVRPGGAAFDLTDEMVEEIDGRVRRLEAEVEPVAELFFNASSVQSRLEGVGAVTPDLCRRHGFVGPVARACDVPRDARHDHPYGVFRFAQIPVAGAWGGDVLSRALVRRLEIRRSLEFVREQVASLPRGDVRVPCGPLGPDEMAVALEESWRGEVVHVVLTDSHGRVRRHKVIDPSFHNWSALALAMPGNEISDFPLCNKSFNLSYAGHDL